MAQRPACADRAATALFSCTAADDRFPRMAVFTQPPCLPAAAGRYLLWRETAVKGRMPLRCDHRLLGLQIIKSRQDLAVGAVRQSLSLFTRWAMTAQKEWPLSQSHHTRRLEYTLTASGVSAPFFFRSHCSASRGCSEARSLNPGRTFCPAQNGQPAFDVTRLATLACQLCPFGHLHQTFRCAPGMTCVGSSGEFFSVSHSESRSGNFAAREFSSGRTARPAQTGQPVPRARILTSER